MKSTTRQYLDVKDRILKSTDENEIRELEQLAEKLMRKRLKEMTWKNKDLLL